MADFKKNRKEVRAVVLKPGEELLINAGPADWDAALKEFLATLDVKESTKKTYKESLNQFHKFITSSGKQFSSLTEKDILEYKQHLISTKLQALTIRSYIVAVHKFYEWTASHHLYENIAVSVKSPRRNQGSPDGEHFLKMHLTDEQAGELLEYYRERGNLRDYAMINLMLRIGLRTIEVSRLDVGDITTMAGRRVITVWGKGMDTKSKDSFNILSDAAWIPIRDYLQTRPGALMGEPLFATEGKGGHLAKDGDGNEYMRPHCGERMSTRLIQLIIKKGLRAIGLDSHEYSAHSLRHTTGCQMIKSGASLMDVQRVLRHSSPTTTMIYLKSIEQEERLSKAPESVLDNAFKSHADKQ